MTLTTFDVSIIIPKEATNTVINPSFGAAATSHTATGAGVSIARVVTQSRRGAASCEVTTATGVISGMYYAVAMTSGTQYSFSADVLDVLGQTFNLFVADGSDNLKSANVTWTGTGYWKRKSVTWTADATATFRLYVTRSAVASTTKYYTDGWQCETGAVSTYIDGDQTGFVSGDTAYRWNGTAHASPSWRSGQTRSGGTCLHLSTYAKILSVVGLGMAGITNLAVSSTLGGAFYQNTVANERGFSLILNVRGSGNYATIETNRSAIINAVKPDLVTRKQPLLLQIDQLDENSSPIAETLMLPANYEGGMEGATGNAWNERLALSFRMFLPMIQQDGQTSMGVLTYQVPVTDANSILRRSGTGQWYKMGTGAAGTVGLTYIYALAVGKDGSIYAGGAFTSMGGVANTKAIARWDGSAWNAMGTGGASGSYVSSIAVAPDGTVYAGGNFSAMGGVADTLNIAKWDGANWTALATGANDTVLALAIGPDGSLYAGGAFTNQGDADGDYLAKWSGSAWSSLGTGAMNGVVYDLAIGPDGTLYVGGNFTNFGDANGDYIAKYKAGAWSSMGTGMNNSVNTLSVGPDGSLYAGGTFTLAGGVVGTVYIAKWNGTTWEPMGTGIPDFASKVSALSDGRVMASVFPYAPNTDVLTWSGSAWTPIDVILPSPTTATSFLFVESTKELYIGFGLAGTAYGAGVNAQSGSTVSYPAITFTGPGVCYQIANYTTGKFIYFNLTLLAGETAVLNLDPKRVSFVSSFRGNILSTILAGSDMNWELLPGTNYVSTFMYGSTSGATEIVITYKNLYWSIDGAVR